MPPAVGIVTSSAPPNAVVEIQAGMQVQPVVLVDQNGNYQATSGSAATAGFLSDLTGSVNVAAATAPSTGQVLTATSATAATWQAGAGLPLTTPGDLVYESAATAPARLGVGSPNQVLGVSSSTLPSWQQGLTLQNATSVGGYTLASSGVPATIATWTAPNDGLLHRVLLFTEAHITTVATGGSVQTTFTAPDGVSTNKSVFGAFTGVNFYYPSNGPSPTNLVIQAGSTFSIVQNATLSSGAGVVWAEIWGS